jgi:hypothetical protein
VPRFGTKSLLIGFIVVGLWLSTIANYTGSEYVFSLLGIACLVSSGCAAVHHRGRRRAFWTAFFIVMLLLGYEGTSSYFPVFVLDPHLLAIRVAERWSRSDQPFWTLVYRSVWLGWILFNATVVGGIVAYTYDQSRNHTE